MEEGHDSHAPISQVNAQTTGPESVLHMTFLWANEYLTTYTKWNGSDGRHFDHTVSDGLRDLVHISAVEQAKCGTEAVKALNCLLFWDICFSLCCWIFFVHT